MTKLGIYMVTYWPPLENDGSSEFNGLQVTVLVAGSADSAKSVVADSKRGGQVEDVGRLGDYDPGIEGHRMVLERPVLMITERV